MSNKIFIVFSFTNYKVLPTFIYWKIILSWWVYVPAWEDEDQLIVRHSVLDTEAQEVQFSSGSEQSWLSSHFAKWWHDSTVYLPKVVKLWCTQCTLFWSSVVIWIALDTISWRLNSCRPRIHRAGSWGMTFFFAKEQAFKRKVPRYQAAMFKQLWCIPADTDVPGFSG